MSFPQLNIHIPPPMMSKYFLPRTPHHTSCGYHHHLANQSLFTAACSSIRSPFPSHPCSFRHRIRRSSSSLPPKFVKSSNYHCSSTCKARIAPTCPCVNCQRIKCGLCVRLRFGCQKLLVAGDNRSSSIIFLSFSIKVCCQELASVQVFAFLLGFWG